MKDVAATVAAWLASGGELSGGALVALKVTALFAAAGVLLLAMRRASASARHLVIGQTLAASLALPLLIWLLPGLPVYEVTVTQSVPAEPALTSQDAVPARPGPAGPGLPANPPGETAPSVTPLAPEAVTPIAAPRSPAFWVAAAWAGGSGLLVLWLFVRAAAMTRVARRAPSIDGDGWTDLLEDQKSRLGVTLPVDLRRGGPGQMPLVWGTRRPVVLLPEGCDEWSPRRRRAVLAHELAHIARRDLTVLMLGKLACAVHWFNPLAWWLGRRLSAERERACDDAALGQGLRATHYAEELLQIALAYGRQRQLAPPMAAQSELEGRIVAILDNRRNRHSTSPWIRAGLSALLVVALLPLAAATVAASDPSPATRAVAWQSDTAEFEQHLLADGLSFADVPALLRGLASDSALTRAACAWRLGEKRDPRAVEPLIEATADPDARVRQWSVRSLRELGDRRAVQPLIARLDDEDPEVREWAARSLADLPDREAIRPLLNRLNDPDRQVREWVARTLGDLGDDRAVDPLIDVLLHDDSDQVREWAARSLGALGDSRAVDPLISAMDDADAGVREWAARSLGALHDERATPALVKALDDPSSQVREWAGRSLGDLGEPKQRTTWRRGKEEPLMPGLGLRTKRKPGDPEAIAGLIRQLDSPSAGEREWAVRSLGSLDDGRAIPHLIDRLEDPAQQVREWASRVLGGLGDARAVLPLIDTLSDPDDQVREWSARSLGLLQDERMVEPLIDRLDDRDSQVREWAVRALGAYGDPRALEPISGMLNDDSKQVRRWAKVALDHMQRTR